MIEWITFSIGTTKHFYFYYLNESMRCYRVEIESIAAIEDLLSRIKYNKVQFVTRYDSPHDYLYQEHMDNTVDRLRKKYQKR